VSPSLLAKPMPPILADLGLITQGDISAWAVTDETNQYRYVLGRMWDDYFFDKDDWWDHEPVRPLWVFGMLNPSKARHDIPDPTLTKCIGFARRGGAGGVLIVNMMAYSETKPPLVVQAWKSGKDVVGPHNFAVLQWALSRPAMLGMNIAAWGIIPPKLRSAAQNSVNQFRCNHSMCFGRNADGSPRHPLMLSYETPLENF
jgi:hypothetical protein